MRPLVLLVTVLALVLFLSSCNSTGLTDPFVEENIVDYVPPSDCDYRISFVPYDETKGLYKLLRSFDDQDNHFYSLTFNGRYVDISCGVINIVYATPGVTYRGVFTIDGVSHPYTIKLAHNIRRENCDNGSSTPRLTWSLPASNKHQFVDARFTTGDGEDDINIPIAANRREYTFSSRAYISVTIGTLNSFYDSGCKLGVYSWSYKDFYFDK